MYFDLPHNVFVLVLVLDLMYLYLYLYLINKKSLYLYLYLYLYLMKCTWPQPWPQPIFHKYCLTNYSNAIWAIVSFCWLRILTTSDQLKEKLWIYLHQTIHMDIRWHKLGCYWFSAIFEKQDGHHSLFLLTQNIDDVRSIKGKVMNISPPYVLYGYKVA